MAHQIARRVTLRVRALLEEEPVIAIQGPRSVGKSTILRAVAGERGVGVLDLDDLPSRDVASADPVSVVAGPAPVCIDEYQHVPELLDAVKAELDRDLRPGRFVLTGSTRHDALPAAAQALTGRLHVITVLPFSQGEIDGVHERFVERLVSDPHSTVDAAVGAGATPASRDEYVRRVIRGGFPLAVARSPAARARWFDDYVRLSLERDARELRRLRRRAGLPRLLEALAGQTAQVLNSAAASQRAGLDERTGDEYVRLLEAVFLVHRLPAWGTTLRARAGARPKVHVVDSGIAARLLRLSEAKLAQLDAPSMTQFGHLLESFAVAEILKQLSWVESPTACGHWRTHDGEEVDLVVERDDGSVIAVEIKASQRVSTADLRAMRALRSALGARFATGVVLYLGGRGYRYDDRLAVLPLDRLWSAAE